MTLFRGATVIAANVTYAGLTATLTPLVPLEYETAYTVAFGPNVADLAGNKLLDASSWQFTTRVAPDIIAPQVVSTSPASGAVGAATNQGVVATFTEPMLAASVNTSSFRVTDRLLAAVPGTVTLDATGMVATFTPTHDLVRGSTYHGALSVALTDVAGNPLAAALAWDFKTAAGPAPVSLGTAANYVILARTGIATTGVSDVTGNMGLSPGVDAVLAGWGQSAATSFSTSPMVDGFIYVSTYDAPTPAKLVLASTDMGAAYSAVAAQGPPDAVGLNAGALGGVTFAPGIYKWNAAATIATNATMQGGPNDVWVFQVNGALAMAASVSIVLSGGARAENVFWQVNGAINIGATSHFVGIALASTAIRGICGGRGASPSPACQRVSSEPSTGKHPNTRRRERCPGRPQRLGIEAGQRDVDPHRQPYRSVFSRGSRACRLRLSPAGAGPDWARAEAYGDVISRLNARAALGGPLGWAEQRLHGRDSADLLTNN